MKGLADVVEKATLNAIEVAVTRVPRDVFNAIKFFAERERNPRAKRALYTMIEAIKVATSEGVPLCQDTGLPTFIVRVGNRFPAKASAIRAIKKAVIEATKKGILRPNAVDPLTNENTGTNVGRYSPWIEVELFKGDELEVYFIPRGGGCESVSRLYTLPPSLGWEELPKAVLQSILDAGARPCPPTFVFVGIGGTASMATSLARRCALRTWGSRPSNALGNLEEKLLELANSLGIGPMGLGGDTTVLDIRIEVGSRHPATFVVAIQFSCWALRKAHFVVGRDRSVWLDPNDFWSP